MNFLNDNTGFLYADGGFLTGFASAFDLGGTLVVYNESASPNEADARAIASDWNGVWQDLKIAVSASDQEKNAE